jgi:hypothetical protein
MSRKNADESRRAFYRLEHNKLSRSRFSDRSEKRKDAKKRQDPPRYPGEPSHSFASLRFRFLGDGMF